MDTQAPPAAHHVLQDTITQLLQVHPAPMHAQPEHIAGQGLAAAQLALLAPTNQMQLKGVVHNVVLEPIATLKQ